MIKNMTFLGSGSAFTLNNFHSNVLVEDESGRKLLIDAGSDVRHSLNEIGKSHLDVDGVFISHLHSDHAGGLEWLGLMTHFDPRYNGRPKLFISKGLRGRLWSSTLSGGMETLQVDVANLDTYFTVTAVPKNGAFLWEDTGFKLVQTVHIVSGLSFEYSYGLLFDTPKGKVFYTADTQYAPNQLNDFYNLADIIFHDCETAPFKSGVHANYADLKTLPEEVKAKMWLYHVNDGDLPDAEADGFAGIVEKGQTFKFM